ncbi:MAG: AarF/ABC1/UbiB kinase family protein [Anaerolineae bacterium]|nr:AarF/ABC1/UbiB kinase family protein [Anaerolineae bacterium]
MTDVLHMPYVSGGLEQPYTPQFAEAQLKKAGLGRAAWRVFQILSVLLTALLWRTLDRWRWTYRRGETKEDRQRRRAQWLLDRLIWLGPTFIKVGQSLGTRPDLLPVVYVNILATLQDQLPPFSNDVAFCLIEQELGWKPETLFDQFDPQPIAAASLGQVYYAVTHEGQEVAVKVQRPDLFYRIGLDLALVRRLAAVVQRFPRLSRSLEWVSVVDEFGAKLFEELDYVHEAQMAQRFRADVEQIPGIYVPRVYSEFSSRRVLTTEFIHGFKISDKEQLQAAAIDIPSLLRRGVRTNLRQLLDNGFFHADPHPGNLFVRPEDGTLVFLDFGMMGIVGPEDKRAVVEIFVDVINGRPDNLRDNLIRLNFLHPDSPWDELVPYVNQLFGATFGAQDRRYTLRDVTNAFAPLLYEYRFRIPVNFALIARAIITLEGISLQLDPEFDIFTVSAPYAVRMMLTLPDSGLRQRLMDELLTPEGTLDWQRLQQLVRLAAREQGFPRRLSSDSQRSDLTEIPLEGHDDPGPDSLIGPALDMLLSPEGAALRRALVAELLRAPEERDSHLEELGQFLSADPTLPPHRIIDRLVAFVFSPEGAETRAQLAAGFKSNGNFDLARLLDLSAAAGRVNSAFRTSVVLRSVGSYLISEQGRPARDRLLRTGAERIVGGLLHTLDRLQQPALRATPPPS